MAGLLDSVNECSAHTYNVNLRWRNRAASSTALFSVLNEPLEAKIAAGLLRVLGEHVDGFCVTDNATDDDFESASGMQFHFTSQEKAQKFKDSLSLYLTPQLLVEIHVR
ncbi:hypothetical protein ACFOY8_15930 [Thalassospira xianhensis]|uniref:Uncharacterized protein n=1 Tax=Thalassospira xianhensis MCCC 1A02616 TaxID=1177929 RepID=A0A367UA62_9PROT|nr:hypothetical protein [Thalassospira xianhensis]RCK04164.1 hypothetical protein TH5_21010 [Thalassospira xianhensis MCCC 1A02616]